MFWILLLREAVLEGGPSSVSTGGPGLCPAGRFLLSLSSQGVNEEQQAAGALGPGAPSSWLPVSTQVPLQPPCSGQGTGRPRLSLGWSWGVGACPHRPDHFGGL